MLVCLMDNLKAATMQVGRNAIDYIQRYMTEERVVRVTSDGTQEFLAVNQQTINGIVNDLSIGKFDIEISLQPYGRTAREAEFLKLVDMMQFILNANPQLANILIPIYVKACDSAYKNEILQKIQEMQSGGADPQQQAQAQQVQQEMTTQALQSGQLENEKKKGEIEKLALENAEKTLSIQELQDGQHIARQVQQTLAGNAA